MPHKASQSQKKKVIFPCSKDLEKCFQKLIQGWLLYILNIVVILWWNIFGTFCGLQRKYLRKQTLQHLRFWYENLYFIFFWCWHRKRSKTICSNLREVVQKSQTWRSFLSENNLSINLHLLILSGCKGPTVNRLKEHTQVSESIVDTLNTSDWYSTGFIHKLANTIIVFYLWYIWLQAWPSLLFYWFLDNYSSNNIGKHHSLFNT